MLRNFLYRSVGVYADAATIIVEVVEISLPNTFVE